MLHEQCPLARSLLRCLGMLFLAALSATASDFKSWESQQCYVLCHSSRSIKLQAADTISNEPDLADGMISASTQDQLAGEEAQPAELPPAAGQISTSSMDAAPESQPIQRAKVQTSEKAAGSRSSSLSPQPSLHLHTDMHGKQQGLALPRRAASAAQAPAPAAQEEEPWQEVKKSRRRSVLQQAASSSEVGAHEAPEVRRAASAQETAALSPSRLRKRQTAPQHAEQPLLSSRKAAVPAHAQPKHAAAEHLSQTLSASAEDTPQQPSQHEGPKPLQTPLSQGILPSMQYEPYKALADGSAPHQACTAFLEMPHTGLRSGSSRHEQVCMLVWRESDRTSQLVESSLSAHLPA